MVHPAVKFGHGAGGEGDPERVFALTQDYARRLTWDPFLRSAELMDGASAPGVGVRAWCVARSGVGLETEYVSFAPPRIAAVRMTRGPWVLDGADESSTSRMLSVIPEPVRQSYRGEWQPAYAARNWWDV